MNQNNLQNLQLVFNSLCEINTKGNDTVLMGQCLQVLQQILQEETAAMQEKENEAVEEE